MEIGFKLYEELRDTQPEEFEALQLEMALTCEANGWCMEDGCDEDGKRYLIIKPPYEPAVDELKPAKLAEVDKWTANKITGGFVSTCYNGESILYDTDTNTQLTMSIAKICSEGERFAEELPDGLEVRGYEQVDVDEDGTLVFSKHKTIYYFSPEQIKTWNEDFALFLRECKKEGWMKQAEVNACTTKEELAKVVLNY